MALAGLLVGTTWGWDRILRLLPCHRIVWYKTSTPHPAEGWSGTLLVSSHGTGDLWDIPWDQYQSGTSHGISLNVTEM
ncbi:hypothetical protein BDR22DRAFT_838092 [Usnea florida]